MTKYYDADEQDFEKELVGHRIVSIKDDTLVLDNGKTLVMEDTSDCCAYFSVTGVKFSDDLADNVVTAVTSRSSEEGGEYDEAFSIVVLSEAKELAVIDIDGTASSGYYCHSINLEVREA